MICYHKLRSFGSEIHDRSLEAISWFVDKATPDFLQLQDSFQGGVYFGVYGAGSVACSNVNRNAHCQAAAHAFSNSLREQEEERIHTGIGGPGECD